MENLISKWKNAQNSLKKDKPASSRLSSSGKNQYAFSSSSSESNSPQQKKITEKNRYLLPTKTEVVSTSTASVDHLSNRPNVVSPPKKNEKKNFTGLQTPEAEYYSKRSQQSGKKNGTPTSHYEKSESKERKVSKNAPHAEPVETENISRQANQPIKKGIPFMIDQASYKIMDIFKYNSDLNNQEKLQRVKRVVEDVVDSASSKTEELETQINNLRQETKRMSLMSRNDTSSKIVSELEARLCESEREKLQLKKEKEQLANQLNSVNKENELTGTNSELIKMLTKNQQLLEENNQQLLRQLQEANRREEEQQFIWQNEVNDLTEILKLLKEQLTANQVESV